MLLTACGATTALLTGCDLLGDAPGPGPAADPAREAIREVLVATTALAALVAESARAHPRLAPTVEGLRLLHDDHLRVLGDLGLPAGSATPAVAPTVPDRPTRALRRLRRAEAEHLRLLLDVARRSPDGTLARVLACMGAGVAQQLVVVPEELA